MKYIATILSILALTLATYGLNEKYGGADLFGAISFPTSLDTFTNPTATSKTNSPSHATQHSNANDAIEALEAKVGIDGSAVTSSHDYKLSGVTGSDKAASLTGSETLTNKTLISSILNSPSATNTTATTTTLYGTTTIDANGENIVLNIGSDAAGDIYYRSASGYLTRLAPGTNGQVLETTGSSIQWADGGGGGPSSFFFEQSLGTYASTSWSVTTDGSQTLYVWITGTIDRSSNAQTAYAVLDYAGEQVSISGKSFIEGSIADEKQQFSIVWASTTPNQTANLDVNDNGAGGWNIEDVTIMYQIF